MPVASARYWVFIKNGGKHVFMHPDVEQLELQGYQVISGLLRDLSAVIKCSQSDFFWNWSTMKEVKRFPIESRLFQKLPTRHRRRVC